MNLEKYFTRIIKETGLSRKEVQNLVKDKKKELNGIVSEKNALLIILDRIGLSDFIDRVRQ